MVDEKGVADNIDKILSGSRQFEIPGADGTISKYCIVMPTAEEARQGQWEYTKAYNRALVEGVFTSNEMLDILKKRNIIGTEYEGHLEKLQMDVQEKLVEMELAETSEERKTKALEVVELREEIIQWNNRFAGPMNNTAEQLSADARIDYFTRVLVRHENGDKVWSSEQDYMSENDQFLFIRARMEVMLWLEGLPSDAFENTPEQIVLREIEKAELDEAAPDEVISDEVSTSAPDPVVEEKVEEDKMEKAPEKPKRRGRKKKTTNKK